MSSTRQRASSRRSRAGCRTCRFAIVCPVRSIESHTNIPIAQDISNVTRRPLHVRTVRRWAGNAMAMRTGFLHARESKHNATHHHSICSESQLLCPVEIPMSAEALPTSKAARSPKSASCLTPSYGTILCSP